MSSVTHDTPLDARGSGPAAGRVGAGLAFAVVSAVSFGMAGGLARGLIDTGWSPGAMTLVRVALAATVLTPFGLAALRGRWSLLRSNLGLLLTYGVVAVA